MRKRKYSWERMMNQAIHSTGSALYRTIIEIAEDHRVLIENHQGVVTYGKDKIIIKTKYGSVSVCGSGLEMMHMSKEQLTIIGGIQCISLHRREHP